jgi:CheY-like chemotaxis protein
MSKKKVLIVENEELIAKAYKGYLEKLGYEVVWAGDGEKGLETAKTMMPDLILSDIAMPIMDGLTMLQKLRENPQTEAIPVVMLTNMNTNENVLQALKLGSTHYLIKVDYNLDELGKKVQELLN